MVKFTSKSQSPSKISAKASELLTNQVCQPVEAVLKPTGTPWNNSDDSLDISRYSMRENGRRLKRRAVSDKETYPGEVASMINCTYYFSETRSSYSRLNIPTALPNILGVDIRT